eukprot:symbB.v1.2.002825.t1/scaffold144.1/size299099/3
MPIQFDTSSWTALERDFNHHIESPHPDTAYEAASCLNDLLARAEPRHLTDLPPEPVAHALLGFLQRHPRDGWFQNRGCEALHRLCEKFPELCTALQRNPSVYATVRAAAKADPSLETTHRFWYTKELCVWLQPPRPDEGAPAVQQPCDE